MTTDPDPFDALTVPGDLNALPWLDAEGKSEFASPLGLTLEDEDMLFQDTVPIGDLPH
jgi:hypothetical protein